MARLPPLVGEPGGLVGLVEEDIDEVHAPSTVARSDALAVGGEVEAEEGEIAIETGDLPAAHHLPQPQRAVDRVGYHVATVAGERHRVHPFAVALQGAGGPARHLPQPQRAGIGAGHYV